MNGFETQGGDGLPRSTALRNFTCKGYKWSTRVFLERRPVVELSTGGMARHLEGVRPPPYG